jgi:hypothetical protein
MDIQMPMMGICVNIRVLVRSSHWDEMIVARRFRNCLRIIVSAKIVARCRRRGRACPAQKGRSKRRPYSGCLLSTANCNIIRHLVGSVSALMSWQDLGFTKNSETVSLSRHVLVGWASSPSIKWDGLEAHPAGITAWKPIPPRRSRSDPYSLWIKLLRITSAPGVSIKGDKRPAAG